MLKQRMYCERIIYLQWDRKNERKRDDFWSEKFTSNPLRNWKLQKRSHQKFFLINALCSVYSFYALSADEFHKGSKCLPPSAIVPFTCPRLSRALSLSFPHFSKSVPSPHSKKMPLLTLSSIWPCNFVSFYFHMFAEY